MVNETDKAASELLSYALLGLDSPIKRSHLFEDAYLLRATILYLSGDLPGCAALVYHYREQIIEGWIP